MYYVYERVNSLHETRDFKTRSASLVAPPLQSTLFVALSLCVCAEPSSCFLCVFNGILPFNVQVILRSEQTEPSNCRLTTTTIITEVRLGI